MKKLYCVVFVLAIITGLIHAQTSSLDLTITNIRNSNGSVKWAVFKNESQYKTNSEYVDAGSVESKTGSVIINLKDIPDGNYSISVYHDENNNSQIDFNLLGLPVEGFGFSNNPIIYFGAPEYRECVFEKKGKTSKTIKLKYYL